MISRISRAWRRRRASDWIAALENDNSAARGSSRFADWQGNEDNAAALSSVAAQWQTLQSDAVLPAALLEERYAADLADARRGTEKHGGMPLLSARFAAALAVLLMAGATWLFWPQGPAPVTYATLYGETETVDLADGSRLVLSPNTALAITLEDDRRSAILDHGTVFFDVARKPDAPFSIQAGDAAVTVLGTAFMVSRGEREDTVTVVEGRVAVAVAETETQLGADERLRFGRGVLAHDRNVDARAEIAWTTGRWTFRDTPLSKVAERLHAFHGIEVSFADPALGNETLTGIYRTEDADAVLGAIALKPGISVERTGMSVTLLGDETR